MVLATARRSIVVCACIAISGCSAPPPPTQNRMPPAGRTLANEAPVGRVSPVVIAGGSVLTAIGAIGFVLGGGDPPSGSSSTN
jgi:hypothetical protein